MARQRFIWPTIWDDPDLGRLPEAAVLLYIACFSNADDDGRLIGEPSHLRSIAFRYRDLTLDQVTALRDQLTTACKSFIVYEKDGTDYIAFANWDEFQKPKYPRPSKLPPPPGFKRTGRKPAPRSQKLSPKRSEHVPNALPNGSEGVPPRVGQGRDGLKAEERELQTGAASTTANGLLFAQELLVSKLLAHIGSHADEGTENVVRSYATHLPENVLAKVLESSETTKPRDRAAYVVGALRDEMPAAPVEPPAPRRGEPPAPPKAPQP